MASVKVTVGARTDVGRVRNNNEDSFAVAELGTGEGVESGGPARAFQVGEQGLLLALSDGMGGHEAGEVASALVVESMQHALREGEQDPSVQNRIEQAAQQANTEVVKLATESNRQGMGATLTAVLIQGTEAYIAQVGDSRAYLLRQDSLLQLTRDQSLVQLLVDRGILSEEEARTSSQKNVILQAMGLGETISAAIGRISLCQGDALLLCCDGISNSMEDAELARMLHTPDPSTACGQLVDLSNDRGGLDNLTCIVAHCTGDALPPPEGHPLGEALEILTVFNSRSGRNKGITSSQRITTYPSPAKAREQADKPRATESDEGEDDPEGPEQTGANPGTEQPSDPSLAERTLTPLLRWSLLAGLIVMAWLFCRRFFA